MNKIKPIAIHLPQYHPIPENDKWWGKGFTEWTNVTKSKPLFKGHYQPHLPADLGFYDLRLEESRLAQESLAKEHGIYGFCYYHYWFNGKRILSDPVDCKLKNLKEDFPFMLCWANENWTRRWDGGDETVLLNQDYSEEDAINHALHLIPYFKDERYIRINNKPVFIVYSSTLIPPKVQYIKIFKRTLAQHKIHPYLIRFETNDTHGDQYLLDFDAAAEFQPFCGYFTRFREQTKSYFTLNSFLKKKILKIIKTNKFENIFQKLLDLENKYDYQKYVDYIINNYNYPKNYTFYPAVTPMWDNTARRGKQGYLFYNSTPQDFARWLEYHINNYQPNSIEENFLFINAWNEWAEGNHLEPCQKWGNAYLIKIKEILG